MTKNTIPTEDLWRVVEITGAYVVQGWDGKAYQNIWIGPKAEAYKILDTQLAAEQQAAHLAATESKRHLADGLR